MPHERTSRVMRDTMERAIRRSGLVLPRPVFPDAPDEATADIPLARTGSTPRAPIVTAASVTVLALLAFLSSLYVARAVILPVVVAILASFVLRGPVRRLRRLGIREPLGAGIIVLGFVFVVVTAIGLLSGPAISWADRAPQALSDVERKVRKVTRPMTRWIATAQRVEEMASVATPTGGKAAPVVVSATRASWATRAFGGAVSLAVAGLTVTFLTYFLLASGDLFMRKLVKVLPFNADRQGVPRKISDEVELAIARYLRTTLFINIGLGIATWGLLLLLGMPNAGLWGSMAAMLNFIPYLGALLTTAVLTVAAIAVFESVSSALLVPAAFLLLNLIESNLVTPTLLGRQFPLNTVAIFIGLMLWGFVWGVPGAILAVPIMVTLKILCDRVPSLRPFGEFLGQ
ncbi:MAG: AI-2E family transporter [Gemmatimonadaceae bacterium]|nr:AI-2E family transporter [Gemmatimonadaceae bacterium]